MAAVGYVMVEYLLSMFYKWWMMVIECLINIGWSCSNMVDQSYFTFNSQSWVRMIEKGQQWLSRCQHSWEQKGLKFKHVKTIHAEKTVRDPTLWVKQLAVPLANIRWSQTLPFWTHKNNNLRHLHLVPLSGLKYRQQGASQHCGGAPPCPWTTLTWPRLGGSVLANMTVVDSWVVNLTTLV